MACPAGIEPATTDLEGRCSIQLSYGQLRAIMPRSFDPMQPTFRMANTIKQGRGIGQLCEKLLQPG